MCHKCWFLTEIRLFVSRSNKKSPPFQKRLKVWKAMSQKLFEVGIPNLTQIVFNYYQMNYKCYFGFIYYDVVTMATNVAKDNPYPHIRLTIVMCLTVKGVVKTFDKSHAIISSTQFWTNHPIKHFQTIKMQYYNKKMFYYPEILHGTNSLWFIAIEARTLQQCIWLAHKTHIRSQVPFSPCTHGICSP